MSALGGNGGGEGIKQKTGKGNDGRINGRDWGK